MNYVKREGQVPEERGSVVREDSPEYIVATPLDSEVPF